MSKHLAALAALSILASTPARADDGSLVWRTVESEHFVVQYYEPNEDIARRVAVVAERAHRSVSAALGHTPAEKTVIVVTDDTDGANGFASVVPRNMIHLFASAPGPTSTLNDHDDWLYGLVAHEYSHIIHLDTIGGLPWLYNKIFGKRWAPNQVQPRWFVEGLATYEESKRSSGGRTRSAIFDMYLRTSVLAGKDLDLAQVSSGTQLWPHGNAAYLYGSHFLKFIADRYGDDKIAKISKEYGRQAFPFGLNRALARAVGKNYVELYDEWIDFMHKRYALQAAAVERRGRIDGRRLTDSGETNTLPRFSAGGREIWWYRSDGWSRGQYRAIAPGQDAADSRQVAVIDGGGTFTPLRDGSGMVIDRGMTWRTYYDFGDLYRYDFAGEKLTRLTEGARAGDPDVSPDGRWLAFEINGRSRRRIAVMDFRPGAAIEIVWQGPGRYDQAYSPRISPDGKKIAFSAWTEGGYHDLYVYDRDSKTTARLTEDRAIDTFPVWSPDGRWIYFTSDRSGIYNIYALSTDGATLKQVTNVLGGTFTMDVSPDGKTIVYQGFDDDGYEMYELAVDEAKWLEPEPYADDRPDPVAVRDGEVPVTDPRPYRPLETLLPLTYTFQQTIDSFGSAFSVVTGGGDVVGWHGWSLGVTYGFTRGDIGMGGSYAYARFWPVLRASFGRSVGRPGGLIIDGRSQRYTEESWGATGSIGLPLLRRPGVSSDISVAYDIDWLRNVDGELPEDPNMSVPRAPETGVIAGLALRWTLSNARRFVYTLGPSEGRALSAGIRYNHPVLGSDFEGLQLEYRWQEYWTLWWKHIVSFRLSGGIEQTDRRRDGAYFLGGLGQQDIPSAILNSTRVGTSVLHGYQGVQLRGRQFHLLGMEYRIPVWEIERGVATIPIYVRRLHLAALFDAGMAADDFSTDAIKYAVGGSIRLDVIFGYYASGAFDLGFARGLSQGGSNEWWFLLTQVL